MGINFVVAELSDEELVLFEALVKAMPHSSLKQKLEEAIHESKDV